MSFATFKPDPFFNRVHELAALDRAGKQHGKGGQMMLLYGRRRLGKTYLLQRYFTGGVTGNEEPKPHCYFLAEQTTAQMQRLALAGQILIALPSTGVSPEELAVSWNALLRYVSQEARQRDAAASRFALILDELPYLTAQTSELPSILQAWWDREEIHAPHFLILCGFSTLRHGRARSRKRAAFRSPIIWAAMSSRTSVRNGCRRTRRKSCG